MARGGQATPETFSPGWRRCSAVIGSPGAQISRHQPDRLGRAIIGMVVAEFFTAITGLGALTVKYGNRYDTASMFVPIMVLMLLGILLTSLVRRAEEQFAPWRMADD